MHFLLLLTKYNVFSLATEYTDEMNNFHVNIFCKTVLNVICKYYVFHL